MPPVDLQATVVENAAVKGHYRRMALHAPEVAAAAAPGQFVHLRIPSLRDKVLRRPFSVCDASSERVTIFYKIVGEGTAAMEALRPGGRCSIMGPLGVSFSIPAPGRLPVIAVGGYGAAATYLLARRCHAPGVLLAGARTADDLVLLDDYRALGFDVQAATDDGSAGRRGVATALLAPYLARAAAGEPVDFYGCGPRAMMEAMARLLAAAGLDGELSMERHMCCGMGACYACVVQTRDPHAQKGWSYSRACREGPVFKASSLWLPD